MTTRLMITGTLILCLGAGAALADDPPQIIRQGLMKQIAGAMGTLSAIAKGQKPYDPVVVEGALTTIATDAKDFPGHFPEGSETGNGTEASPAIWQNMADFVAHADKLSVTAEAQLAALPADPAAVAKSMQAIGANCGACHQLYRVSN
ncbi:c-type cytochrome [Martelella alba]|nr:cytochrome c [Martelella alba]